MPEFDLTEARRVVAALRADVQDGSQWEHVKRGSRYWVQAVALREADGEPLVIYRDSEAGTCWARPAAEFLDGRFRRVD